MQLPGLYVILKHKQNLISRNMASADNSDSNSSLKASFDSAETLRKSLEETFDCNCDTYQDKVRAAIAAYKECKDVVEAVSLFSPNETLEDVSSSEIK